jgi:Nucleotide modification associated domain 3
MNAMLLRVGIDKGTDGILAPIFKDGSFEYIPPSEIDLDSSESRTYESVVGTTGKSLATYLPGKIRKCKIHFDPEFETFTYGDSSSKRNFLLKLEKDDILIFYAGLTPFKTKIYREALYIIGYFSVQKVIDFNQLTKSQIKEYHDYFPKNAHLKRKHDIKDLIIVAGDKKRSKLIDKAILISAKKYNKIGRQYHVVSPEMEELLGIKGSIQRSIPPRFIKDEKNIKNLKQILNLR